MVGNTFARPRLWSFVQEHDLRAIDNVGLHTCNVQKPLNLIHPNHVMIRRSPNLINHNKTKSQNISTLHIQTNSTSHISSNTLYASLTFLPEQHDDLCDGSNNKSTKSYHNNPNNTYCIHFY